MIESSFQADEYPFETLKNKSNWGLCGLIVAGLMYPFRFIVYRNDLLHTGFALTIVFSFGTVHATFNLLLTTFETPVYIFIQVLTNTKLKK